MDNQELLEVTSKESDQRSVEPEGKFSDEAHQGEVQKVEEIPAKPDKKTGLVTSCISCSIIMCGE